VEKSVRVEWSARGTCRYRRKEGKQSSGVALAA
jgi:hypothetical protein